MCLLASLGHDVSFLQKEVVLPGYFYFLWHREYSFLTAQVGTEARITTRVQSHCRKKPHTWYGGFCSQSPSSSLFQSLGLLAPASRKCFSQSFKYRKESMTPEAHVCITFVMHMCACGGQKTTRWGQFSSITWVSGDVGVPSGCCDYH